MKQEKLIATGLNKQQASAYALLLENGEIAPPEAAKQLKTSRTNCYKLYERLVELGLATKKEAAKKIVYSLTNPQALSNLVAEQRNLVVSREGAVRSVISELLAKYHSHTEQPDIKTVTGKTAVANAYRAQIRQGQSIYFLRSRMDIPSMGFDTMHELRLEPSRHGASRYGITPDISAGTTLNSSSDKRSNLKRTWMRQEDYTAPAEWSVSGSSLLIVIFGKEPHAITIDNPIVAEAFKQIWHLLDDCIRQMDYYRNLPRTNNKNTTK